MPDWPGSMHDSRIFQNSRLYIRYVQGKLNGIIIGDAGYSSLPFLLTPIADPDTEEQIKFDIFVFCVYK